MPFFGVPIRNGLPIGLGSVAGFGVQQFDPSQLFEGGTVAGAWYDPSDLSTMFDTSAGTTPVAMPGLGAAVPVGLMLDKSQGGVGTNGAARYNVLIGTNLLESGWTGFNASRATVSIATPIGTTSASRIAVSSTSASEKVWFINSAPSVAAASHVASIYAKAETLSWIYLRCDNGTAAGVYFNLSGGGTVGTADGGAVGTIQALADGWYRCTVTRTLSAGGGYGAVQLATGDGVKSFTGTTNDSVLVCGADLRLASQAALFPTYQRIDANWYSTMAGNHAIAFNNTTARPELRARVNLLVATATLSTQNVTTQATSYTLRFAGTGSITLSGTATGSYSAGTHTITCTAGTLTLTVSGTVTTADLRPANSGALLPAYQAVVDANTYDTSGFPLYLRFDGIDDSMYTPANLNLSGTDKVAVFAGVRKLSDAAAGVLTEFTADINANNGSFIVTAPSGAGGANYLFGSKGTIRVDATGTATFAAPVSSVVCGIGDIAGDVATLRVNGSQNATNAANQGAGNYANAALYIGSRANSSIWLNGHLHSLIIAGSAVSAGNISATEQWVAQRTGIVIP